MITEKEFNKAISKFDELEKRGSFYNMAVNLFNNNFEIEAYFLILATWNFAYFRYKVKNFDIERFKEKNKGLNRCFDKLPTEEFNKIKFDKYKEDIEMIYDTLSSIKEIKYTGASKIMHLKKRNVFIMWDSYIKGNEPKKYYNELNIVRKGDWKIKRYGNSAKDYLQFLKDMQELFGHVKFRSDKKTFAKAIDEFNYINITLPIQKMKKEEKRK